MTIDVERLLTVQEVAEKYQLSLWCIYENIRSEPTFPAINIGPRRNYRIYEGKLKCWLNKRPAKTRAIGKYIPTADDILQELEL